MSVNIVMGVTGASGARYAQRLIQCLADSKVHVHLVMSPHGRQLFAEELGIDPITVQSIMGYTCEWITMYPSDDLGCLIASGSFRIRGMVICPCSSNSLGAIASGLGENLLHRAAQVTLKEGRRLVLVYRETPMSQVDLRNALTLSQAGAVICPANPGFYMSPQTVGDLVDFVVGKVLDLMDVQHNLNTRWDPEAQHRRAICSDAQIQK